MSSCHGSGCLLPDSIIMLEQVLGWLRSHQLIDITQLPSSDLPLNDLFDLDFNGRRDFKCISWFTFLSRLFLHQIFLLTYL